MSVLSLQIGQCGNQIGKSLYDHIINEMINASPASQAAAGDIFFDYSEKTKKYTARSLLIDMEPKVINECFTSQKKENLWDYDKSLHFCKQEGSGNNWAYGYNIHGPACRDNILEKFNRLLEGSDFVDCVVFFQSLAGGTGSGVGSYFLEAIREEHPELTIMNVAIAPHLTGEVIVQNYNTMFTLGSLYDNSDGIMIIENDTLSLICKNLMHLKKPNLQDMNRVLVNMLSSVMYPVFPDSNSSYFSSLQNKFKLGESLSSLLVTNPSYKLITVKNCPQMPDTYKDFTNDSWGGLEKRIHQMLLGNSSEADINWQVSSKSKYFNKSIANLVIARGTDVNNYNFDAFQSKDIYTQNISTGYSILKDAHLCNKNQKSISLLSNSQAFLVPLETVAKNAAQMFHTKAYVYQYERSKLTNDDFQEALAKIEQIHHNYSEL
jgi:tubulin delta